MPLPLFIDEHEGERGVIYSYLAKANHNGAHHNLSMYRKNHPPDDRSSFAPTAPDDPSG
jgi:hypothetical protein